MPTNNTKTNEERRVEALSRTAKKLREDLMHSGFDAQEFSYQYDNDQELLDAVKNSQYRSLIPAHTRPTPTARPADKRPFYPYDSDHEIFAELRKHVLDKGSRKYRDPGYLMKLQQMSNEDIIKEAEKLDLIDPEEGTYLEDRLSGKNHDIEESDAKYLHPIQDRLPDTRSADDIERGSNAEENVASILNQSGRTPTVNAGLSARGLNPERSALRTSSNSDVSPQIPSSSSSSSDIDALNTRVNAGSSSSSPLVQRVREANERLQERTSQRENDPINDFANRLGRPAEEERRRVHFPEGLRDSVTPEASRFRTTPENDPDDEEEYNTLATQIPENIKKSRTVDMRDRKFKDTLDLRKLAAEKKIEGYNADRTYFKNSMYVNPTELQEEAYDMIRLDDPYSKEKVDEHNELLRTLRPALTKNYASDASAPFLNRMSENPAKYHKEIMGNVESDHLDTINNRASREFNEKILPGIRAKYQSPGLLQHGHMDRDIGRASELAARGLHEANSKAALDIRGLTLNAALQHANMQGQGAAIAGNAAVKDSEAKLGAVKSARETQAEYSNRKELQRLRKLEVGSIQRGEKIEKKKMQRDHVLKPEQDEQAHIERLALGMNAIRDPNIRTPADVEQKTPVTTGNNLKALSKAGGGAGRKLIASDFESTDFAKGGIVKGNRIKRASGGSVNTMTEEAIENAITQRTDPLAELRRLFNTDIRKANPWETKKYYAIGGQVSPIEAGAEAAKEYSLQRAQISRMRQAPKKKPIWLEALDAGMSAAAGPDGGAFGNMASGWTSDLNRENAEHKERQAKLSQADELEYKLEKDIAEKAHKEREFARQEMLAKAQMDHYGAQNTHLALQGDKIRHEMNLGLIEGQDPDDRPTGRQKKENFEAIKEAEHKSNIALQVIQKADEIQKLKDKVKTGYIPGKINSVFGAGIAGAVSGSNADDITHLETKINEYIRLLDKLERSKGEGRNSNLQTNLLIGSKVHMGLSNDDIDGILAGNREAANMILDESSDSIKRNFGSKNERTKPLSYKWKAPVVKKDTSDAPKNSTQPVVGVKNAQPSIKSVSTDELKKIAAGG